MTGLSLVGKATAAQSFIATLWRHKTLTSRARIDAWQDRRLKRFFRHIAPQVSAYASDEFTSMDAFPVLDKAKVMGAFEQYNREQIDAQTGWAAFKNGSEINGLHVGASTGTSGNRGLYLVSEHERFIWLGVILAKALPDVFRRRHRVAIILPNNSALYDAANDSKWLSLSFFDLSQGVDEVIAGVNAFEPTVIVAPPKILLALARAEMNIKPQKVFSGGEVLEPFEGAEISDRFCLKVGQIYMATEGLFAVSCPHGSLHLAEDVVKFEFEDVGGLSSPIVTDFTRYTQVMPRYRMNDLLRLNSEPCSCGSAMQRVDAIVGRCDDMLVFNRTTDQKVIRLSPDVIRNTILDSDRSISDFRVEQTGADKLTLKLLSREGYALNSATAKLQAELLKHGLNVIIQSQACDFSFPMDRKLRRVINSSEVKA